MTQSDSYPTPSLVQISSWYQWETSVGNLINCTITVLLSRHVLLKFTSHPSKKKAPHSLLTPEIDNAQYLQKRLCKEKYEGHKG